MTIEQFIKKAKIINNTATVIGIVFVIVSIVMLFALPTYRYGEDSYRFADDFLVTLGVLFTGISLALAMISIPNLFFRRKQTKLNWFKADATPVRIKTEKERLLNDTKFRNRVIYTSLAYFVLFILGVVMMIQGLRGGFRLAIGSILYLVFMIGAGALIMGVCFYFMHLLQYAKPLPDPFPENEPYKGYEYEVVTPEAKEEENKEDDSE